jgi:glycosyltransferase involved in cell wall biosynthesis
MKISILIPTRNRRKYLEEALNSARNQSYEDLEILVSDDGSTDETRAYVQGVAAQDGRVRLLADNPEPGIFTNMGHLVRASSGDAFCLLGDDDRLAPTYIAKLLAPLQRDPAVVLSFCDHGIIDASGKLLEEHTNSHSRQYGRLDLREGIVTDPRTVAFRQTICFGFALFRSSVFREQRFDLTCGSAADLDYNLRASNLGQLYFVAERLGDYRNHLGAATHHGNIAAALGMLRVVEKHPPRSPEQANLHRALAARGSWGAASSLCGRERLRAARYLSRYVAATGRAGVPRAAGLFLLNFLPEGWGRRARQLPDAIRKLAGA